MGKSINSWGQVSRSTIHLGGRKRKSEDVVCAMLREANNVPSNARAGTHRVASLCRLVARASSKSAHDQLQGAGGGRRIFAQGGSDVRPTLPAQHVQDRIAQ